MANAFSAKPRNCSGLAPNRSAKASSIIEGASFSTPGAIDATDFYTGTAHSDSRSRMNVCFRLPSEELEARFVKEAAGEGLMALKGYRTVGGIRASIYNAVEPASVEALVQFMEAFEAANG